MYSYLLFGLLLCAVFFALRPKSERRTRNTKPSGPPPVETEKEKELRLAREKAEEEARRKKVWRVGKWLFATCLIACLVFFGPSVYRHWSGPGQASNWRMPGHEREVDRSYSGEVTILKLPVGKMTRWEWKKGKLGHADPDGMVKILTGSGKRWEDGPDLQGPVLDTVREPRDLIWYYLPIGDKPVTVTIIEG